MAENLKSKINKARKDTETNLTDKQKESGNYKKGHINVNGFKISLENPKGSYRSGKDKNGKEWKIKMKNDYGYFLNTEGYDGDHIDCFLGNAIDSTKIFVIDQKIDGEFDESKVMLWFDDKESAKNAYLSNYEKDWKGFDEITEVEEDFFKKWLYDGKKQLKPFHEYYEVKKKCNKMKIKESTLKEFIKEAINNVLIKEGKESTILTNKLIKELYKVSLPYTKHLYKDDAWENAHELMDTISTVEGVADFNFGGGRYHQVKDGGLYKEYTLEILTKYETKIGGKLQCHMNGTLENPYSSYDMTVSFYRESENPSMFECKTLKENYDNIYTMKDWNRNGSLKLKIGQYIDDEVFEELLNSVPPATYKSLLFQPGEAYTISKDYIDLYLTFVKDGNWKYVGLCPKGSNKRMLAYDEKEYLGESIVEESRGLKSMKLFQIAKEHGGLKPKHSMHTFRFNDFTDNDVIGVIEGDELEMYKNASWSSKKEWAKRKGYTVNRGDEVVFTPMKDWTWVAVIERGSLLPDKEWKETPYGKKRIERGNNRKMDGKRNYIWSDTDLNGKNGLKGWSKRAFEFSQMKSNNDLRNGILRK